MDKSNPVYQGGSDAAYDFNTLREKGLIEQTYLDHKVNGCGGVVPQNPGVKVTAKGLETVANASKTWLRRAIEKTTDHIFADYCHRITRYLNLHWWVVSWEVRHASY